MGFIDCDSHVMECDETWDYFDPDERIYRPRLLLGETPEAPGIDPPGYWIVGDTWGRRPPKDGNLYGNGNTYDPGTMGLSDPARRVADIDALGIDVQVIISTFFIGVELDNAAAEAAITRSYNRFMAERLNGYTDRLPWTVRAPLRNMPRAMEELEFGKANGAVGIQMRGIEHGTYLSDRSFWPLYEKAQDLDLPIIIHIGTAVRRHSIPVGKLVPAPEALTDHLYPMMSGFHALVAGDLYKRFPRLRFAFVEGGSTWVPATLQLHARVAASQSPANFLGINYLTPEQLEERNIFVACESDEDLGYITKWVGEDVLCTGTDYGHNDAGGELGVHESLLRRTDISPAVAHKIVDTNGRKLFGIDPNFQPTDGTAISEMPNIRSSREPDAPPVRYAVTN